MRLISLLSCILFVFLYHALGDVKILTSEESLEEYIASNSLVLVIYKVRNNDADNHQLFTSAKKFFLSNDWKKFIMAVEQQNLVAASSILREQKNTNLGISLGTMIDSLLNSINSNPRFINLVKNIAIVDCEETPEACSMRLELSEDTSEPGVMLQL